MTVRERINGLEKKHKRLPKIAQVIWVGWFKEVLAEYNFPITIRQLYYRMVSDPYNFIENNKWNYGRVLERTAQARKEGTLDWRVFEDTERREISGDDIDRGTSDEFIKTIKGLIKECQDSYSMSMWATQPKYIEVWVEKNALAGIVSKVAKRYKVLTFPSRGYGSITKRKERAEEIATLPNEEKKVLYFGDFDPSGIDFDRVLEADLELEGVKFKRIALWDYQAIDYQFNPNPVKETDTRTKAYVEKYGEHCWELDCLPIADLEEMVGRAIKKEIDWDIWKKRVEEIEKNKTYIAKKMIPLVRRLNETDV
jgi:hypothetical protein